MNYSDFYSRITKFIRASQRRADSLIWFNQYFTWAMYLLYPVILIWAFMKDSRLFAKILVIPAVSFILLTVIRKWINRPRPYEKWDLDVLLDKQTKGCSMPSRHVFSAVVISFCLMTLAPLPAYILLGLCVLYCVERVLIGVHYPSDVIVGFAAGAAAGILVLVL